MMSTESSKPTTPSRLNPSARKTSISVPGSRTSSRAPSPTRSRSPLPPTLKSVASFSSLRNKVQGSYTTTSLPSTTGAQKLTASALPPHLSTDAAGQSGDIVSSSSSVFNVNLEPGEGLLLKESEIEMETQTEVGDGEDGVATGHIEPVVGDEEARRNLRDHLKRTLSQKRDSSADSKPDAQYSLPSSIKGKEKETMPTVEDPLDTQTTSIPENVAPRQYFVITDAGKPVFASSPLASSQDALSSTSGLMQALISVFADDGDRLRCVVAGRTRIAFVLRSPLYFVCVSAWGEPESVIRSHLEYLHLQILSVVTASQLKRIFERRTNFDLRRLLSGAETFLHMLLTRMQTDLAMCTSSLICLSLEQSIRRKAGEALIPSKMKDILYVLLIARGRVITLVRPKKHSVHPSDLHILLNTVHAPAVFESPASWLPICLPKFNPSGFLHVYVSFLRQGDVSDSGEEIKSPETPKSAPMTIPIQTLSIESTPASATSSRLTSTSASPMPSGIDTSAPVSIASGESTPKTTTPADTSSISGSGSSTTSGKERSDGGSLEGVEAILAPPPKDSLDTSRIGNRLGLGLVCVSGGGGGEFETIRSWCESVQKKLEESGTLDAIERAVKNGNTDYSATSLGIPGLRHFVYKSRPHVQVTHPTWDEEYTDPEARRRLITLYQTMHDAIHGKSGQKEALKLQYIKTERESVMGWITQPFELYLSVSPLLPKSAIVSAANAVMRWVKKEEARLFLRDAPVF